MDDDESPPQVVLPLFCVAQMTVGGGGRDGLHSDEDVALDAAQQSPPPRRAPLMTATLTLAPPQQPGSVVARLPSARSSSSTTKRRSRSKPLVFSTKAAAVLDKRAFRVETLEYQRDAVQRAQKQRHHKSRSPPSRPSHQATARRSAAAGGGGAPSAAATAAFPSPPPQQAPPWLEHGRRAVCNAPLMERSSDATMIDVPVALHVDLQARVVDDRHNDKIAGDSDGDGEYDEIIDGVIIHRFAAAPRQDSIKVLPSPVRTVLASPQPFASPTPHRQQHMSHSPPVQPLHSSASLNGLPSPITPQLAPGGAASPAPAPRPLSNLEAKAVEFQLRYGMSAGSAVHFARRPPMRTPLPFFFD